MFLQCYIILNMKWTYEKDKDQILVFVYDVSQSVMAHMAMGKTCPLVYILVYILHITCQ